ncbi:MAG: histidine kinase, partial [Chloroflexi bacterium]|nr:histidine kinase [Chloroflexota bacterium]
EVVAMVIIYFVDTPDYLAETLVDGLIMLALLMPGLYFLQLKPLLKQIEERTRAEAALRNNEELLKKVLELMPVGVWILDKDGKVIHGNPASQKIWSGARYVGPEQYGEYKGWRADTGQQLKADDWAASRTIAYGETILEEELEIESFDGVRKFILNSSVPILDDQNKVKGGIVVNQDITARKKMERDLQQSEELFRTAVEALPVGVWLTDASGKINYGNLAGQRIWAGAHYVGIDQFGEYKGWWVDTGKPIEPDDWAVARAIRRQETSIDEEIEIECFDGTHKRILNSAVPLYDQNKNVSGAFIVNQDITSIRQAERDRLRANALLERFFLSIDTLIAYMDRDFNFIRVNTAYAASAGHSPEFFVGKNHFELYPHEENEAIFRNVVETGEPFSVAEKPFEYAEYPERGVTYWDWRLLPVRGPDGAVEGIVMSLIDVTARKQYEQQLAHRNQELLELSNAERKQRELAESLMRASMILNTSLEPERIAHSILELIRKAISYEGAGVVLVDGKTIHLAGFLGFENFPECVGAIERLPGLEGFPLFEQVRTSSQPVLMDSRQVAPGMGMAPGFEWVKSYLAAPLIVDNNLNGVIILTSDSPKAFTKEMEEQLQAFAAPAALALHNARLFEQIGNARERLQSLARQLVTVQESERQSIARELHDEASQSLSSLKLSLTRLEQAPECPPGIAGQLSELKNVTDGVLEELHRLAMDLRPAALDHLGLVPALEEYANGMNSDKLSVRFKAVGFDHERLSRELEISLYRIVQEALTNVLRHAQASVVGILLERSAGKVKLFVEDDGIGLPAGQSQRSGRLGLVGMRERAEMLGGSLTIESMAGKGTTIIVEAPDDNTNSNR